jgi:Winged helix-turn helix
MTRAKDTTEPEIRFTPQVPVHRAAERDKAKIAAWRAVT